MNKRTIHLFITPFYLFAVYLSNSYAQSIEFANASIWIPQNDVSEMLELDNGFSFNSTASDPYIMTNPIQISATEFKAVEISMKMDKGTQGQLFWSSTIYPQITEQNSLRFKTIPDGKFHTYLLSLSHHSRWKESITRLRLDPTDQKTNITIASFRLLPHAGPHLQVSSPIFNKTIHEPGNPIEVKVIIENRGDTTGTVQTKLYFPDQLDLDMIPTTKQMNISPNTNQTLSWTIDIQKEWAGKVVCNWELLDDTHSTLSKSGSTHSMLQVTQTNDNQTYTLHSGSAKLEVHPTGLGYGSIALAAGAKKMAWMPRVSTVMAYMDDGATDSWAIFTSQPKYISDQQIQFNKTWKDRNDRDWHFSLQIKNHESIEGAFLFHYKLQSAGGKLIHFSGPELLAGEGSFGSQKEQAIFPGIEYLNADDVSSSDAVAHPPVRDHYMPHPAKVTVPFMSISHENHLIALLWETQTGWNQQNDLLSPKFASPNRLQKQNNHLMGLFVPNVPNYVVENQDMAHKPYVMTKDEPIEFECVVYLSPNKTALDAVDVWLDLYQQKQLPAIPSEPRPYKESIAISRRAYFESCWNDDALGWGHCAGWAPLSSGGFLALLDLDRQLTTDVSQKNIVEERIDLVKQNMISKHGITSLGDAHGCHVMSLEPGFYWGIMEHKLSEWLQKIKGYQSSQNEDGSWGFYPDGEDQTNLGNKGQVESGTIGQKAAFILKYARITANQEATEIGLKAIDAMNQFRVPRGAQGWECPISSADILASAYCAQANLDAHLITGKQYYLDQAVYWAKTGIVFHYLWNQDETPLQRYATIPIFGATFFTHTWRGVPVQWCGLVYSYALLQLAEYDDTFDWKHIAAGIVNSALIQQLTDGDYAGTLPDSYADYFQTPKPAYINPENILTNLHELKGNGFSINTQFVEPPSPNALRISAIADIQKINVSDNTLQFRIHPRHQKSTEILITPLPSKPFSVHKNNNMIAEMKESWTVNTGWKYIKEHNALLIHTNQDDNPSDLTVHF